MNLACSGCEVADRLLCDIMRRAATSTFADLNRNFRSPLTTSLGRKGAIGGLQGREEVVRLVF